MHAEHRAFPLQEDSDRNLLKVLNSPALDWIWPRFHKSFRKVGSQGTPESRPVQYCLRTISIALNYGLQPLRPWEALTKSARNKKALRIAHLAEALAVELSSLNEDDSEESEIFPTAPSGLMTAYDSYAVGMREEVLSILCEGSNDNPSVIRSLYEVLDEESKKDFEAALELLYFKAARDLPQLLSDVAWGATYWATEEMPVYRPADPNAPRLVFLRRLTQVFQKSFGALHREETLALAGVFFDTAGLDAAALSRLAPAPRRRKKPLRSGE